jgi:branched-chain amino acid transport system permease protein
VVAGTLSASTVLGTLDTSMTFLTTPVFGEVSLLVGAVLLVRALPQGITGRLFRGAI